MLISFFSAFLLFFSCTTLADAAINKSNVSGYQFAAEVNSVVDIKHENFSCEGKGYGYYADEALDCKVFHICSPVPGPREKTFMFSFFCPEKTIFSQDSRTCIAEEYALPCERAHTLYSLNEALGRAPSNNRWKHNSNSHNSNNNNFPSRTITTQKPQEITAKPKVSSFPKSRNKSNIKVNAVKESAQVEVIDISEESKDLKLKDILQADTDVGNRNHRFKLGVDFESDLQPEIINFNTNSQNENSETFSSSIKKIQNPKRLFTVTTEKIVTLPIEDITEKNLRFKLGVDLESNLQPDIVNFNSNSQNENSKAFSSSIKKIQNPKRLGTVTTEKIVTLPIEDITVTNEYIQELPETTTQKFDTNVVSFKTISNFKSHNTPKKVIDNISDDIILNTNNRFLTVTPILNKNQETLQSFQIEDNYQNFETEAKHFDSPVITIDNFSPSPLFNDNNLSNRNILNFKTNNKFTVVLPEKTNSEFSTNDFVPPEILMPPPIIRFSETESTDSNVRHVVKLKTPNIFQSKSFRDKDHEVEELIEEIIENEKQLENQVPINNLQPEPFNSFPKDVKESPKINKQTIIIKKVSNALNKENKEILDQTPIPDLKSAQATIDEAGKVKVSANNRRRKTSRHKAIQISNSLPFSNSHTGPLNLNNNNIPKIQKPFEDSEKKINNTYYDISRSLNLHSDINNENNIKYKDVNQQPSLINDDTSNVNLSSQKPTQRGTSLKNRSRNRGSIRSQTNEINASTPVSIISTEQGNGNTIISITSTQRTTSRNRGSKRFSPTQIHGNAFGARTVSKSVTNIADNQNTDQRNNLNDLTSHLANENINNRAKSLISSDKIVTEKKSQDDSEIKAKLISEDKHLIASNDVGKINKINTKANPSLSRQRKVEILDSKINNNQEDKIKNIRLVPKDTASLTARSANSKIELPEEVPSQHQNESNIDLNENVSKTNLRRRNGRVRKIFKNAVSNNNTLNESVSLNRNKDVVTLLPELQNTENHLNINKTSNLNEEIKVIKLPSKVPKVSPNEEKNENPSELINPSENNSKIQERKTQIKRIIKKVGKLNNTIEKESDNAPDKVLAKKNILKSIENNAVKEIKNITLQELTEPKISSLPSEISRQNTRSRGHQKFEISDNANNGQLNDESIPTRISSRKRLRSRRIEQSTSVKNVSANISDSNTVDTPLLSDIKNISIKTSDIPKEKDLQDTLVNGRNDLASQRVRVRLRRPSKEVHSGVLPVKPVSDVDVANNTDTKVIVSAQNLLKENTTSNSDIKSILGTDTLSTSRRINRRRNLNKNLDRNNLQLTSTLNEENNLKEETKNVTPVTTTESNKLSRNLSPRRNKFRIKSVEKSNDNAQNTSAKAVESPKEIITPDSNIKSKSSITSNEAEREKISGSPRSPLSSIRRRIASRQRGKSNDENVTNNSNINTDIDKQKTSQQTTDVPLKASQLDDTNLEQQNKNNESYERKTINEPRFRPRTRVRLEGRNSAKVVNDNDKIIKNQTENDSNKSINNLPLSKEINTVPINNKIPKKIDDTDIVSRVFGLSDIKSSSNGNQQEPRLKTPKLRLVGTSVKSSVSSSNRRPNSQDLSISENDKNTNEVLPEHQTSLNDLELSALKALTYVNEPLKTKTFETLR